VKRRAFIAFLTTAAAPLVTNAQRSPPVVGYLSNGSANTHAWLVAAFLKGLGEGGYVEGRNVTIEYRWGDGQPDRLPKLAADLVRRRVSVIVATAGSAAAVAAKSATSTIPIVFTGGGDPVKLGLVASLGRPGGNATGILNIATALYAKRLQLLHDLLPSNVSAAALLGPASDVDKLSEIQNAARAMGWQLEAVRLTGEREIDAAFASIVQKHAGVLFVDSDPLFLIQRERLVGLAAKHAIPASYAFREFVESGGLMSYGANLPDVHRQAGVYAGRILDGAKPADLPVLEPVKFDLVINLNTAKRLAITIPPRLLAIAEVIQ
jgi:putative tryptophan/tyrosine transport system substrate-binding protein